MATYRKNSPGYNDKAKILADSKKSIADLNAKADKYGKYIEKSKEEVKTANFPNLINQTVKLYGRINKSSFNYVSALQVAKEDQIEYQVKIEPKTDLKFIQAGKPREFPVNVDVKGGIRFSFSTGVFATKLHNRKYIVQNQYAGPANDTITGYRIAEQDGGKLKMGLCALGHVNLLDFHNIPLVNEVNFSPSFGIGLLNDGLLSYLFGGSLIFGQEHRFIFSLGGVAGEIESLSDSLPIEHTYQTAPSITTQKKTDWSYYFAISYNL